MKLIKKSGQEYQIARFLSKQSTLSSLEGFDGVLAPLDLLDITDHCIVVYPRYIPDCFVFDHFLMHDIVDGAIGLSALAFRPSVKF